jgi:hypothetical protein
MNKKAAITDAIFVPVYLLLIAVTILIGAFVWFSFQSGMTQVVSKTPHNVTINTAMSEISVGILSMNYMYPILVIGLLLISLLFAFRTGASVIYAFLSIVLWAFAMLMSAVYSNIWEIFAKTVPSMVVQYNIIAYIMESMKWLVLGWLFLISVIMFTRNKKDEAGMAASEMVYGGAGYG